MASSSHTHSSHPSDVQKAAGPPKKRGPDLSVNEILESCLDAEHAADLIAHRKAKKAPLSAGAAKQLVKKLTEFGNPTLAVQTMLVRGWTGFDPEWMANARAGPQQSRNGMHTVHAKLNGFGNEPDHSDNPFDQPATHGEPGHVRSRDAVPEQGREEPGGKVLDLIKNGPEWS